MLPQLSCDSGAGSGSADAGITGLNCAGFGSAMVVTASFGMQAAGLVLRKLALAEAKADVATAADNTTDKLAADIVPDVHIF